MTRFAGSPQARQAVRHPATTATPMVLWGCSVNLFVFLRLVKQVMACSEGRVMAARGAEEWSSCSYAYITERRSSSFA
jgi:hypothetical protein